MKQRIQGLDVFRGWAIILMLLFHLSYDLKYFNFIDIDLKQDTFWIYARYVIVNMFLFSVGVSLALLHHSQIQWKKVYKRSLFLGLAALLVSIATYIQFPDRWVYFGILHFVFFASYLGLLFIPYPHISLVLALAIFLGSYLNILHTKVLYSLVKEPLHLPQYTEDLVPIFPWFGVILLGISLVGLGYHKRFFSLSLFSHTSSFHTFLNVLGRYALIIYLIHQPILFRFIMLMHTLYT